jgi:hypothetical protein
MPRCQSNYLQVQLQQDSKVQLPCHLLVVWRPIREQTQLYVWYDKVSTSNTTQALVDVSTLGLATMKMFKRCTEARLDTESVQHANILTTRSETNNG